MTQATPSLGSRAASGMVWLASQTVAARLFTILAQWVLANFLLGPEEFGQIGLVYTITVLATQLTSPGVDDVLLQHQSRIRRWVTPAFWISLSCAIAGAVVMSVAGGIVVLVAQSRGNLAYGNSDIFFMTLILAAGAPLNAASMVPNVMLRSELRFARLAGINLGEIVAQQVLIVLFAALGFGTYSFVIPMPLVAGVRLVVLWLLVRPPLRRTLALHRWPALIGSTGWVFGQRMLNTIISQGDRIVLGALFADEALVGLYFYAFTLSMQIVRVLCDNLATVVLPVLTTIKDDPQRLGLAAARASKALASLVIPVVAIQILLAGPGVRLLFIDKWQPMIPLIQLLGIGLLVVGPAYPMTAMLTAAGRFRDNFLIYVFNTICFFAVLIPATWFWGGIGTAAGVSAWCWLAVAAVAVMAYRSLDGAATLIKSIGPSLLAAGVAAVPVFLLERLVPESRVGQVLSLTIGPPLLFSVYYLVLKYLDPPAMDELIREFGGALRTVTRRFIRGGQTA